MAGISSNRYKPTKGAIAFHLEGLHEEGYETPQPHSISAYVEVAA